MNPRAPLSTLRTPTLQSLLLLLAALLIVPAAPAALVGFYPFDDTANPAADASGNGHDLQSASADPVYQSSGGIQGGAYQFNGAQHLVAPIDINPANYSSLTIGAWVKTSTLNSGLRKIIGSDDGGWDRTIGLDDREGPFRYASFIGNGPPLLGGPTPVSTNQWTFIAATYDQVANSVTLYVDLDASTLGPISEVTGPTGFSSGFTTFSIGSIRPDNTAEAWEGMIDNVFVFDEVLSRERIAAIRNGGKNAILGLPGDDPDLTDVAPPNLDNLSKVPSVHSFTVDFRNGGFVQPLHINRVTLTGPDAAYFSVGTLPGAVAPGATASIPFVFDGKGQVGSFAVTAVIESDDSGTPSISLELNATVVSQALLGFYSFDDEANPRKDDSGNGRTLVDGLDGGAANPTYNSAGGVAGGAFEFNGTQRLVSPLNINAALVPRITMGAWVKTANLDPGLRKVLGQDDGGWDRVIGLDTRSIAGGGPLADGTFRYAAFTGVNNNGPSQGDPPPTPVSTDAWTFLAADYDQVGNLLKLYVDLDAATVDDDPQVVTAAANLGGGTTTTSIGSVGPLGNGEGWVGAIDNVFFLGGSVDAATMKAIRDGGKSVLQQFAPDPALAVLTDPVFGALPDGSVRTVTIQIRNSGATQPLQIAGAKVTGRDAASYQLGPIPTTVAAGATAGIAVALDPQGRKGLFRATLEITSNDSAGRKRLIDLFASVPFPTPESALIGYYPFDDETNPLKDQSGHGHDLIKVGLVEPTLLPDGGFHGAGYDFQGTSHFVAPIDINVEELPLLTMGAWVKASTLGGLHKVIGSDNGGWDRTIGMDDREGGLRYTTFVGNNSPLQSTPTPDNVDSWSFIAATYDQFNNRVTMYVDLDATTTNDPVVAVTGPTGFGGGFQTVSIGSLRPDNTDEGWVGQIDTVFFYQKVLSLEEITALRDREAAARNEVRLRSVEKTPGAMTFSWNSKSGEFFHVDYKQTWEAPWVTIEPSIFAVDIKTVYSDTDAGRLSKSTGFYRVAKEE